MTATTNKVLTPAHIESFKKIVGEEFVLIDGESLEHYSHDETETLRYLPEVVIRPKTAQEISAIMKICNEYRIPVTPRGAGTGLSGGALPHHGGVVLSTDRMNAILHIDERNLQITTEPGVITEVLQNAVKEKGLFYPPDPSSRGSCFIGGNISANSGGPKAVKYGVVKDYVLNLEVVLPTGEIIQTGSNVLKNSTGYNLTQLIVGSEGTLGIVTKIVLKLIPFPKYDLLMLVPFASLEKASEAVSAIFRAGFTPSAVELVEIDALQIVSKWVDSYAVPVTDDIAAHLIIEVDGNHMDTLMNEMEQIAELTTQYEGGEVFFADDAQQKAELWKLRPHCCSRKTNQRNNKYSFFHPLSFGDQFSLSVIPSGGSMIHLKFINDSLLTNNQRKARLFRSGNKRISVFLADSDGGKAASFKPQAASSYNQAAD